MTDELFDGRTDGFFGRTDFWTDGFKKKFSTDCQKFLNGLFWAIFFGNFQAIFWQIELFP